MQSSPWASVALNCTYKRINHAIQVFDGYDRQYSLFIVGIPDKAFWNPRTYLSSLAQYQQLGYKFTPGLETKPFNTISSFFSMRTSSNTNVSFLGLDQLPLKSSFDYSSYFYDLDLHLNYLGNVEISRYLSAHPLVKDFLSAY